MSKAQKFLKILSVLVIVVASVQLLVGALIVALPFVAEVEMTVDVDGSLVDARSLMVTAGSMVVFLSIIQYVLAALGLRGAKDPRKIGPVLVLSVIGLLFACLSAINQAFVGALDASTLVSDAINILVIGSVLIAAVVIYRNQDSYKPEGTKDFSDPKKLGFMRFLEVYYLLHIVLAIVSLVLFHKEDWDLGFDMWLNLMSVVFEGIALWLIWRQKQYGRQIIIGMSAVNIVVGSVHNAIAGTFDPVMQIALCSFDIVIILYFATSRRAKALMVQPFSVESAQAELEEEEGFFKLKTFAFWRNLAIYFCVFSVVGHWMEAAYCTLIKYGLIPGTYDPNSQIWSDWLYPFMVYGFGFVACVLLLFPLKNWLQEKLKGNAAPLVLSFIANALVCTAIELTMGLMLNTPAGPDGKLPLWDYSDIPFNFMGQVCLQNALAFGMVATLMVWVVYPGLEKLIGRLPRDVMNIVFVGVLVGFAVLYFLYYINVQVPGLDSMVVYDSSGSDVNVS